MDKTYISIEDLLSFKGSICVYSAEFENGLGEKYKEILKNILTENIITYNESLKNDANSDLILINGDEFNPSKVGGLIKKYEVPIVIFLSDEIKKDKLKDCLLKECLILDKINLTEINFFEFIKNNIQEKERKEKEKLLKQEIENVNYIEDNIKNNNITEEIINNEIINEVNDIHNDIIENITNKNIYYLLNDIEFINNLKNNFESKYIYLNLSDNITDCNFIIIDLNYCTINELCDFLDKINNIPVILIGYATDNIDNIIYYYNQNYLKIEKPLNTNNNIMNIIENYLKNFNKDLNEIKEKRKDYDPRIGIPANIFDNEIELKIRNLYNKKFYKEMKKEKELNLNEKIKETKIAINENNRRLDKKHSLNEIYEKMGLNSISIFDSQIDKGFYFYSDGQVVTYKPEGYIIEYRIKRLKLKGLNGDELNKKMKELEDSDIKFQQNKLKKIEKLYK